jgi:proteasome lid subunit RPN8/RPN11
MANALIGKKMNPLNLENNTIHAIKNDALEKYPLESCGYVKDGIYFPEKNLAENPKEDFKMRDDLLLTEGIQALIHSHPNGALHKHHNFPYPSLEDMRAQMSCDIPFGILWTDGKFASDLIFWGDSLPIKELKRREFIHGVYDCYSLIRDYFRSTKSIILKDFPRSYEWWAKKDREDLYTRNFELAGFERISFDQLKIGDVFLAQIHSKQVNHGGIYIGNNLILHHLDRKVSCTEPILRWQKYITHYLRYFG